MNDAHANSNDEIITPELITGITKLNTLINNLPIG